MVFTNKSLIRLFFQFILLIFISVMIFRIGMYVKFLINLYYGDGVYIDVHDINQGFVESEDWKGLPGMENYCIEEGYEKGDINCVKNK